jgi:hypothetical protein
MVPFDAVYLIGFLPIGIIWALFFFVRKDLRQEMLVTSALIGVLSLVTAYYWWTRDWWHPATITHTRVGIEDFLMGFFTGGVMAAAYEVIFSKRFYKMKFGGVQRLGGLTILLLLDCLMMYFFYALGFKSFYASSIALALTAIVMFWERPDLIIDGITSGFLMIAITSISYLTVYLISPSWIAQTYYPDGFGSIPVLGVPIEEFIFWFLAGLLFGPFYEYARRLRLRRSRN